MQKFNLILGILFCSVIYSCHPSEVSAEQHPNIVFILLDDLGYSDVGYMNHKAGINSPNINKLVKLSLLLFLSISKCPVF